jgi:amidase
MVFIAARIAHGEAKQGGEHMVGTQFTGPEICAKPAHEVVAMLKAGEVSPGELIDAAMARIAAVEPAVNAVVTTCEARARAAVPDRGQADHPGWLAGLPIGIKDLTPVEGVRTTWGTLGYADHVPAASHPLVKRLEARGGIVLGKTNTPEMGAGANTFNAVFGATRNPWDTSRNAGGSSGGAAVSLATGELWLSHGSDLAGSLRTPAAFCGVVGFRPSPGLVSPGPSGNRFHPEAVQGPMARSVRDCALFLDAMAGFNPDWAISFPPPEEPYQQAVLRADEKVRIAFAPTLGGFAPCSAEVEAHLRRALTQVARAGGVVEEDCPELPGLDRAYRTLRGLLWISGTGREPEHIQRHYKPTLAQNIQQGRELTVDDVTHAHMVKSDLFDRMTAFLKQFDVLACPVVGLMPGPVEEEFPREMDGQPLTDYIDWLKFSFLSPTVGLPAVSVPVGLSESGLPVGIQLIGRPRGEARLLQVARAVEAACGGPLGPIDPVAFRG